MAMDQTQLQQTAYDSIWADLQAAGFVHSSGNSDDTDFNDAMVTAVAKAISLIVPHIVANSELVSVVHDTGSAGAGIITGSVK